MSESKAVLLRPIRWDRLRTDEAEREIRRRLAIASPAISVHAFDRSRERQEQGILNTVDMISILRTGSVCEPPRREGNGWKAVVEKRMPGSRRSAGVVTVIVIPGDDLEVVTVEWMDWR
jgi:hypothetical protein